jgi:hypothetical protein
MLDGFGHWIFRFFSSRSVGSPFFVVLSVKVYPTLFWFFFSSLLFYRATDLLSSYFAAVVWGGGDEWTNEWMGQDLMDC